MDFTLMPQESYCKKLVHFLEFHNDITDDQLLQKAKKNPKTIQHMIIDYVEERKSKVSGSTLQQTKGALKHFFEMNDVEEGVNLNEMLTEYEFAFFDDTYCYTSEFAGESWAREGCSK